LVLVFHGCGWNQETGDGAKTQQEGLNDEASGAPSGAPIQVFVSTA
jgi:hypothetical protein